MNNHIALEIPVHEPQSLFMNHIRLHIIEDNRNLREGITEILHDQQDITIIADSGKSDHPVRKSHDLKPDVILLSMGLRCRNSLRVVTLAGKEFPKARIIVMDRSPVRSSSADCVKILESEQQIFAPVLFLYTLKAIFAIKCLRRLA